MRNIFLFPLAMHSSDNLIDVYWLTMSESVSMKERMHKTKGNAQ